MLLLRAEEVELLLFLLLNEFERIKPDAFERMHLWCVADTGDCGQQQICLFIWSFCHISSVEMLLHMKV